MDILESGVRVDGVVYGHRKCCYGIAKRNGKFLLVYSNHDKNFSLPGGGIEKKESSKETITREFVEEVGLKVLNCKEIVAVHSYCYNPRTGIYLEKFDKFLLVEIDENFEQIPTEDWHERVWIDESEFKNYVKIHYQLKAFDYYLNSQKTNNIVF